MRKADIEDMTFFRNILSTNKRIDADMEAGNQHSDVELADMEAGSRSAHSVHSLYPDTMSLDPRSTFPCSFPMPNLGSEGRNHAPPPSQVSSTSLNNRRRSQNDDRISSKIRVVEQGSNISVRVRLYAIKIKNLLNYFIERDWKAISSRFGKIVDGTPRDGRGTTKEGRTTDSQSQPTS